MRPTATAIARQPSGPKADLSRTVATVPRAIRCEGDPACRALETGQAARRQDTGIGTIAHHHDIAGCSTTRRTRRRGRALGLLAGLLAFGLGYVADPTEAAAETRTLNLHYTHTGKSAKITFKKNGRYLKSGLQQANKFLADWRTKDQIKIDPRLLDTVWEVYQKLGTRKPIHVVSSYRSPKTNAMLRKTRGGQAKNSQHMYGRALDFFIPGVSPKKVREVGLKAQSGGVGYYAKSGFVHLDTGRVRHWPRMSRKELVRVFPKGGTLHVPTDGKALPGYKTAEADYKRRMANGGATALRGVRGGGGGGGNILTALFRGGDDDGGDAGSAGATAAAPQIARLPRRGPKASARPAAGSAPVIRTVDPSDVDPLPGIEDAQPAPAGTQAVQETIVASLPTQPPLPEFRPGDEAERALEPTLSTDIADAAAVASATPRPVIRPGESRAVAATATLPSPVLAYREVPSVTPAVRALAAIDRSAPADEPREGTASLPSIVVPDDGSKKALTENALRLAFARSATSVAARRSSLVERLGTARAPASETMVPTRSRVAEIDRSKIDALAAALRRQAEEVR